MADVQLGGYPVATRVLTVVSQSGTTLSWTVDRDCELVAVVPLLSNGVVSSEPDLTWAIWSNPVADYITFDFQTFLTYIASKIPLTQGSKLYIAPQSAPMIIQLFLTDLTEPS